MTRDAHQGQTVLVTGATGKLGRQFAHGFASQGASVVFTSRGGEAARGLVESCLSLGAPRAVCVEADLTVAGACRHVVDEVTRAGLLPHVLVNNARNTQFLAVDADGVTHRDNFQGELTLDVVAPYELTMRLAACSPTSLRAVINIASIYGIGAPNLRLYDRPGAEPPVQYGVAKAALIHLTKELAVRLASRNVAVNCVSYGGVGGRASEELQVRYGGLCPAGRMLDESEVFGAVAFLASTAASGITGHNLVVDGGWTAW